MHARDIPVVGGLIDTAIVFISTLGRIARYPFGFVHTVPFDDPNEPQRAFKFIGAAIAVAYLILSPALSRHRFEVGELLFGVVVLFRLLLIVLIYHAIFFVAGYRKPVARSLILGSYINGIYFPFFMTIMLPTYLVIGPQAYFDPLSQQGLTPAQVQALDKPLVRIAQIAFLLGYPVFYALTTYWWAKAFEARIWHSAIFLLVAVVLAAVANVCIISPAIRPFL